MNPNGVKVTGERLTQNSRPGFSLATAKPSRARSRAWTDYPSTIYTNQNHKYHAGFSNFYNLEQKGLLIEEIRENSTSFIIGRVYSPIYIRIKLAKITRMEQKGLKKFKLKSLFNNFFNLNFFFLVNCKIFFHLLISTNEKKFIC